MLESGMGNVVQVLEKLGAEILGGYLIGGAFL